MAVVGQRILVADDEPALAKSTFLLLRALGFDVVTETRAERILATLATSGATILLQDVRMPGLDIDQHVRTLRASAQFKDVKVFLFSASLEVAEVARRLSVDGFLEKPFRPEDIAAVIDPPGVPR